MRTRRETVAALGALTGAGVSPGCLSSLDGDGESGDAVFAGETLTFALLPSIDEETKMAYFAPFQQYLADELDASVELQYEDTYRSTLESLASGDAHVADTGSLTAALGVRNDQLEIALQRKNFGWTYGSVLVTAADNDISSIGDLAGERIGFADRLSTSGMLMPLFMFEQGGLTIGGLPEEDDSEADFSADFTSHSEAWEKLQSGEVAAAGIGQFATLNDENELVEGYEYLDQYQRIPNPPFGTSPELSDQEKSALVSTLADAPDRVYYGEDGTEGTDDDLWFTDLREASVSRYQVVVDAAQTIDIRRDLLETSQ